MKKRREWTITPSDLPDPRILRREPLLEKVEENAAFRMLAYRHESLRRARRIAAAKIFLPLLAIPLMLLAGELWLLMAAVIIAAITLFRSTTSPQLAISDSYLFVLDRARFRDLCLAGTSIQDFMVAVWAYHLPPRRQTLIYQLFPLVSLLAVATPLFWVDWQMRWILTPLLFWPALELGKRRFLPYSVIVTAHDRMEHCANSARYGALWRGCGCSVGLLGALTLVMGSMILLGGAVGSIHESRQKLSGLIMTLFLNAWTPLLASVAAGLLAGVLMGRHLAARKEMWLRLIRMRVETLMEMAFREDALNAERKG